MCHCLLFLYAEANMLTDENSETTVYVVDSLLSSALPSSYTRILNFWYIKAYNAVPANRISTISLRPFHCVTCWHKVISFLFRHRSKYRYQSTEKCTACTIPSLPLLKSLLVSCNCDPTRSDKNRWISPYEIRCRIRISANLKK